jgi:hypothetical protein
MSTNYFILWEKQGLSTIGSVKDAHFYAIEVKGNLVYIGLAYGLNLKSEIYEAIATFRVNVADVSVSIGNIVKNIHNHVNKQLAEDIICLLVYKVKPSLNIICNQSYYGRDGLEIHNRGYKNIPASLSIDTKIPLSSTGS